MDEIIIKGLKAFACNGASNEEKTEGQLFIIDIVAKTDLKMVCVSDNVENTVCYAKLIKTTKEAVSQVKNYFIECVAEKIAESILTVYQNIKSVKVTIKKPNAPITANFDYVGITIERGRDILG